MYQSLKKLTELPEDTLLLISHEYTIANLKFCLSQFPVDAKLAEAKNIITNKLDQQQPTVPTSLGFEKMHNPFLRWDDTEIRETLNMRSAENWQVFSEIRTRKDIS